MYFLNTLKIHGNTLKMHLFRKYIEKNAKYIETKLKYTEIVGTFTSAALVAIISRSAYELSLSSNYERRFFLT